MHPIPHSDKPSQYCTGAEHLQEGRLGVAEGVGGWGVGHAAAAPAAVVAAAGPLVVGVPSAAACCACWSPQWRHEGHTWL